MTDDAKPKVFLLDDEAMLAQMYKQAFERGGYEVAMYFDAWEALRVLRTGDYVPDAILFDITMPGDKSGFEFIELVHEEKLAKRALKIALTSEGRAAVKERLQEIGISAFLHKPEFIPSEIVKIVTDLLSKRG